MNTQTEKSKLVKLLGELRTPPKFLDSGICRNIGYSHSDNYDFINGCYSSWEHFSGCSTFPVPAPKSFLVKYGYEPGHGDPEEIAYCNVSWKHDLDKWSGEYGDLRRDLVRHLIECTEARLKELGD